MYYDFFGFREPPFSIAPDPRYLYLSERHKEALAHLMYGIQGQGGFIVITGEVGTGKTTISRCFIENVPDHVDIALILNPRLSARELLSSICDELEIRHPVDATIKQLVDLINQDLLKAHGAGRHKVLMIDEAQNLSADVLEQLRLLTNLETAEKKLLQIVLLGQPELQAILAQPELRQLNQRVTARYHLDALEREELPAYLRYRLSVAGQRGEIFTDGAIKVLYRASKGVPRLINLISDRALLGAYAEGEHLITSGYIRAAAKEVVGKHTTRPAKQGRAKSPATPYLLLVASILAAVVLTVTLIDRGLVNARTGVNAAESDEDQERIVSGTIERLEIVDSADHTDESSLPVAAQSKKPRLPGQDDLQLSLVDRLVSQAEAFTVLFGLWGEGYRVSEHPIACDYAEQVGLGCLHRQGTRKSLEQLNRPAILTLRHDNGKTGYVTLGSLDDAEAVLQTANGRERWPFSTIEEYWFGDYTVLWRLPPYVTDIGSFAGDDGEHLWLSSQMMELADVHSPDRREQSRIKSLSLEEQIRWYQNLKGLQVDGIAGAMTLIQINNDLNPGVPRLDRVGVFSRAGDSNRTEVFNRAEAIN